MQNITIAFNERQKEIEAKGEKEILKAAKEVKRLKTAQRQSERVIELAKIKESNSKVLPAGCTMSAKKNIETVLKLLRRNGPLGVSEDEMRRWGIRNGRQVIMELRRDYHKNIVTKNHGLLYFVMTDEKKVDVQETLLQQHAENSRENR